MTSFSADPGDYPQAPGVAPEQIGLMLQRGGEELALGRVDDRFTIRLTAADRLSELSDRIQPQSVRAIPNVNLLEMVVPPEALEAAMQQARQSDAVAFASHVYCLQASPQTWVYLGDQLTIQFAESVDLAAVEAIAADFGLHRAQPLPGVPQAYVFEVTKQASENPIKIANRLMRLPVVLVAEPNVSVAIQSLYRPKDPLYPQQWYLNHQGGTDLAANSHIFVEQAWEITRGVRSVVVAVADDAFDLNHPDLQGIGKIVAPQDLRQKDFLPLPEEAHESHGTAAAGVAIAEENGQGVVGVAPGCAFMPIRTTGFLDDEAIDKVFNWAMANGAAVISCSWGAGAVYFPLSLRQRATLTRAATEGRNGKGCVIVFAAGNANRPVSGSINEQGWPKNALNGPTNWLAGFAIHPDVIAVSASTSLGRKALYSNWGSQISVSAPSNNAPPGMWLPELGSVSTGPTVQVQLKGRGVLTSDRLGAAGYSTGDFTPNFGGTSSACPVVAGVAALVLSVNPDLTAREVRQILQKTADKIVDPDPDPQLNLRKGTYNDQGHSEWFGYGKVNALKAVQEARRLRMTPAAATRTIQRQNTSALNIPDATPQGIRSSIQVTDVGKVRDVKVEVDLEHGFLGDLELRLVSPLGRSVLLQGRTLGRQTRLQITYSLQNVPNLYNLLGQACEGQWQLWAIDHAPSDTGRINRWQLTLGLT